MEFRRERRNLLHQVVDQPLPGDHRKPRNVVDGLFRIELGALPARPVEDVDEVAFEVEQSEFEHGEQPHGPAPDHDHIGDDFGFAQFHSQFSMHGRGGTTPTLDPSLKGEGDDGSTYAYDAADRGRCPFTPCGEGWGGGRPNHTVSVSAARRRNGLVPSGTSVTPTGW